MTYRSDLDALAARHAALETEVANRQRDLAQTREMLDEARARARLPVLDNIRVASPCSADWTKMTGDDRARFCGDCKQNVYNLSEMTRDEAEALIGDREGRLCVRYYQRADGTILLKDCTVGVRRRRRRRVIAAGVAATLAGAATGYVVHERHQDQEELVMGYAPRVEPAPAIEPAPVIEMQGQAIQRDPAPTMGRLAPVKAKMGEL